MTWKCFLDMDGVIADFMGALCAVHGRVMPYGPDKPDNYGVFDTEKLWGITSHQFWAPVAHNSLYFWETIKKTPQADRIVEEAEKAFGRENVAILTAPSQDPGSVPGKRMWIERYYPQFRKRMIFATASTKQFIAGPGKMLIDDKDSNCYEFCMAGGSAILVPRPWNQKWAESEEGETATEVVIGLEDWRVWHGRKD